MTQNLLWAAPHSRLRGNLRRHENKFQSRTLWHIPTHHLLCHTLTSNFERGLQGIRPWCTGTVLLVWVRRPQRITCSRLKHLVFLATDQ